jgi:hypothetical protein
MSYNSFSDMFPSKYLSAADLGGKPISLTIKSIKAEMMQDGTAKPCVYFEDEPRGLILNKTNGNVLAEIFGYSTPDWYGKQIVLYPTTVDFQGKSVAAIRVRAPKSAPPQGSQYDDLDDAVPF